MTLRMPLDGTRVRLTFTVVEALSTSPTMETMDGSCSYATVTGCDI